MTTGVNGIERRTARRGPRVAASGVVASLLAGLNLGTGSAPAWAAFSGIWYKATLDDVGAPLDRSNHVAVRLTDGRVLVAGGETGGAVLDTVAIYDPAGKRWSARHAMSEPRTRFAGILLAGPGCGGNCGRVLVVGGRRTVPPSDPVRNGADPSSLQSWAGDRGSLTDGVSNTAEIYDPATDSWTVTQPMTAPRTGHTATLLTSGKVLIAGGDPPPTPRQTSPLTSADLPAGASAEVFDPAAATWTRSAMQVRRSGHTATLLDGPVCRGRSPAGWCGQVLVAGGVDPQTVAGGTTEMYDPRADTWRPGPPMAVKRAGHTSILLDGPVCHRRLSPSYCGTVLVAGGTEGVANGTALTGADSVDSTAHTYSHPAEIFDPAGPGGGTWTALTMEVPFSRPGVTATLLDGPPYCPPPPAPPRDPCGMVLFVGHDQLLAFDPDPSHGAASGAASAPYQMTPLTTTPLKNSGNANSGHSSTLLADGSLLLAGGAMKWSRRLVPTPSELTPLPAPRLTPTTGLSDPDAVDQVVFPIHGPHGGGTDVEIAGTGLTGVRQVEFGLTPEEASRVGGVPGFTDARSFRIDTRRYGRRIHAITPSHAPGWVSVRVWTDHGMVEGDGVTRPTGDSTLLYRYLPDDSQGRWSASAPVAAARTEATATLLTAPACRGNHPPAWCGKVLLVGGRSAVSARSASDPTGRGQAMVPGPRLSSVELFDPVTASWSAASPELAASAEHTATLLADGRVLVLGGTAPGVTVFAQLYDPGRDEWTDVTSNSRDVLPGVATPAAVRTAVNRVGHSATLLNDGRVLVAGGGDPGLLPTVQTSLSSGGADILATSFSELYDPGTSRWAATPPLGMPRSRHTATLLGDGKVLVASGDSAGSKAGPISDASRTTVTNPVPPLTTTELFDPATGRWSSSDPGCIAADAGRRAQGAGASAACPGDVAHARTAGTATLIAGPRCGTVCGKVLLVGGIDAVTGGAAAGAELYDPVTGTWTAAKKEQYDPATKAQTLVDLRLPVFNHTATPLMDGRILFAGGERRPRGTDPCEMTFTGEAGLVRSDWGDQAYIYSPDTQTLDQTDFLRFMRTEHSATRLADGRVFVVGGEQDKCSSLSSTEIFTPFVKGEPPEIAGVTPSRGPASGGTVVTITGRHLSGVTDVTFGRVMAPASGTVLAVRDDRVTVTSPPGPPGPVDVIVSGSNGVSGVTASDRFWYEAAPIVLGLSPSTGASRGGTRVEITGAGFSGAPAPPQAGGVTEVLFDGVAASDVRVTSATRLTAVTPPHPPGPVGVTVSTHPPKAQGSPQSWSSSAATDPRFTYGAGTWSPTGSLSATFDDGESAASSTTFTSAEANFTMADVGLGITGDNIFPGTVITGVRSDGIAVTMSSAAMATGDHLHFSVARVRYGHTATQLDGPRCRDPAPPAYCGRVLVLGGFAVAPVAWSQLYDPATGTFTPTPVPMPEPRNGFTASLLPDGRVLVVGGQGAGCSTGNPGDCPALASAWIFDPDGGRWLPTGSLHVGRLLHTATVLRDGTVLVAGGATRGSGEGTTMTAEVFDPAAPQEPGSPGGTAGGAWRLVGSLGAARSEHSATLLSDGRVLVAGGVNQVVNVASPTVLASAEIYDPSARGGTWTATAPLAVPRFAHTATLIDAAPCGPSCGTVLVAGGGLTANSPGCGSSPQGALPAPSDPTAAPPSTADCRPPAPGAVASGAELFDPGSGQWHPTASLNAARAYHSATRLESGKVLVAGAYSGSAALSSAEIFDPVSGSWMASDAMKSARGAHTATLLEGPGCATRQRPRYCGEVLAVGGADPARTPAIGLDAAELYTPGPDVLSLTPAGGSSAGGTRVTIHGRDFTNVRDVRFGGDRAQYSVVSPTEITAVSPRHDGRGAVRVTVRTDDGVTSGSPAVLFVYDGCASPSPGGIAYPGGVYSLVGLPEGTRIPSDSRLYGWFDQEGGRYSSGDPATATASAGRGYWAWFSCQRPLVLGRGATTARSVLHAHHASMVGNPSATSEATVSGQDFAARWNPVTGGYEFSSYRQPLRLAVGEGAWVFSYSDTTVTVSAPRP